MQNDAQEVMYAVWYVSYDSDNRRRDLMETEKIFRFKHDAVALCTTINKSMEKHLKDQFEQRNAYLATAQREHDALVSAGLRPPREFSKTEFRGVRSDTEGYAYVEEIPVHG